MMNRTSQEVDTVRVRLHQPINFGDHSLIERRSSKGGMTWAAAIRPKHQAQPSKQAKPQTRNGGQPHVQAYSTPLDAVCRQSVAQA